MKLRYLLLLFVANTLMAGETPVLNIDKSRVTTSGISAGALMAHQLHIAYSDIFSGAGIVSGGPYNCAENSMLTALSRCMMNTDEPLPVSEFVAGIHTAAEAGEVADSVDSGLLEITSPRATLVGVAEASLYPSFSLSGSIQLTSGGPGNSDFGDLFSSDALTWSIGPSFVWPFLNYGRIKNNVRVQDARFQQLLVNYQNTVLSALAETENAIVAYLNAHDQARFLGESVVAVLVPEPGAVLDVAVNLDVPVDDRECARRSAQLVGDRQRHAPQGPARDRARRPRRGCPPRSGTRRLTPAASGPPAPPPPKLPPPPPKPPKPPPPICGSTPA